jgi:50S ribosomal protein L16 3-hydroxylase
MFGGTSMQLNDFEIEGFLSDYWQKQPLLIRNAWTTWSNPLAPEELAGLACEAGVESRLITLMKDQLEVEEGPIAETRFTELGEDPWTLLVQAVDHHAPSVAALLEPFRFIPNWRIDDVMVSYATDRGGVGPHFDQYDVFLIQGLGRRRWRLGPICNSRTSLLPHDDLLLLESFEAAHDWILEPGDILYVPPRLAHEGTAIGDGCMTYSIGFRAPSRSELIGHWSEHLLAGLGEDDRYGDPDLQVQENPGEISQAAIVRLHAMVAEKMLDLEAFGRWFGQFSSTPKYPELDWRPENPIEAPEICDHIRSVVLLSRNPASRLSFIRKGGDSVLLFVDGKCFECVGETVALAERLCAQDRMLLSPNLANSDPVIALLAVLVNQGVVAFTVED